MQLETGNRDMNPNPTDGRNRDSKRAWNWLYPLAAVLILILLVLAGNWLANRWYFGPTGPIADRQQWPGVLKLLADDLTPAELEQVQTYYVGHHEYNEYFWRCAAPADVLTPDDWLEMFTIFEEWELVPVEAVDVPDEIWKSGPRWWKPTADHENAYYRSPGFSVVESGRGEEYFIIYDKTARQMFVWNKYYFEF